MTTANNRKVSPLSSKDKDQKETGFFNRPRAGGKTMWDWLNLLGILAIPLVVAGATLVFSIQQANFAQQQRQADQQRALDQQQATILQTYIDNIQDLLLNHNLLKSSPTSDVAVLARARTLASLQGLDSERKGVLLKFIYEAKLIGSVMFTVKPINFIRYNSIIDLNGADLSHADLSHANLIFANLRGANLSGANLSGANLLVADLVVADLSHANLSGTHLINADLSDAYLYYADLSDAGLSGAKLRLANLSGANLSLANLSGANLSDARFLTQQQLDQVYSCKNATLHTGLTCHRTPSS